MCDDLVVHSLVLGHRISLSQSARVFVGPGLVDFKARHALSNAKLYSAHHLVAPGCEVVVSLSCGWVLRRRRRPAVLPFCTIRVVTSGRIAAEFAVAWVAESDYELIPSLVI